MKKKKILAFFAAVAMSSSMLSSLDAFGTSTSTENTNTEGDIQVFSTVTLEDNFTDDVVLLTFKHECSVINKVWTPEDFPECNNIASVDDLTYFDKSDEWIEDYLNKVEFRQILVLHLEETGKDKVLEAIEELEARDDVFGVDANYIGNYSSTITDDPYTSSSESSFNKIDLYEAWDIETGSSDVKVGVIDSFDDYRLQ